MAPVQEKRKETRRTIIPQTGTHLKGPTFAVTKEDYDKKHRGYFVRNVQEDTFFLHDKRSGKERRTGR